MLSLVFSKVHCLSLQNDATMWPSHLDTQLTSSESVECDPSAIPVMENFDMKKFSGSWFECAKSASGYIEVNDGMWKIQTTNTSNTFLFSGRDSNAHCIRPIKGNIHASDQPPGLLTLHYKTYSTQVAETIRVLFTDYVSVAVIYKCVHHIHREKEVCHSAGLMGAVWTREPHVNLQTYESAVRYLEMACVHKSVLIARNLIGPCRLEDIGFHIDDFPVPDFCYQPVDLGFCRGNLQRYYYNPKSKSCESFTYHGCGGNRNNFMSLPECQEKCLSVSPKEQVCLSVADCAIHCAPCCAEDRSGCVQCNCELVIEEDLNCVKSPAFCLPECEVEELYSGCYVCSCDEENEPFIGNDTPDCIEVKAEGNCKEAVERYYFNALARECDKFTYSGCGGNNNNFKSEDECREKCIGIIFKSVITTESPDGASHIMYNKWTLLLLIFMFLCQKMS